MNKNLYLWILLGSILAMVSGEFLFRSIDAEQIVSRIQDNFDQISIQTDDILIAHKRELESGNKNFERLLAIQAAYPVFIFKNDDLIFWSDNSLPVDYAELKRFYKEKILKTPEQSVYYLKKLTAQAGLEYVVVVPLYLKFRSESRVLTPKLSESVFGELKVEIQTEELKNNLIYNKSRNLSLFSIEIRDELLMGFWFNIIQLALFLTMLLAFAQMVRAKLKDLLRKRKNIASFFFLSAMLVLIRFSMIGFKIPYLFYDYEFMSAKIYAASWFCASIGDIFFNALALFFLVLFVFNNNSKLIPYKKILKSKHRVYLTSIFFLLPTLVAYLTKLQVESIFIDSQINLDISKEISFTFPKIMGFALFAIFMVIYFLVGNVCIRFIEKSILSPKVQIQICFLSYLIFGLLSGEWFIGGLSSLYLLFCLFMGYAFSLRDYEKGAFSYMISTVLVFALMGTSFVGEFSVEKSYETKKKFASKLALENDFKAEWHLNMLKSKIKQDTSFYHYLSSTEEIGQKINSMLPRYFSSYEFSIDIEAPSSGQKIKSIEDKIVSTSFEDVYLYSDLKPLDRHYVCVIDLRKDKELQGQIFLEIRQKNPLNNSIVEKITNFGYYNPFHIGDLAYGHVRWGNLITSSGSFLYDNAFMIEYEKNIDKQNYTFYFNGFDHFAEPDGEGGHFIASSAVFSYGDYFSNFAFIFLFLTFNILLILSILGYIYREQELKLSFASKIQFYLNSAFFIPFLIVSIVIVSILNYTSRQETTLFFLDKAENMAQRILERTQELNTEKISADSLSELLKAYSSILQADLNYYGKDGLLLASSQDYIFRNKLLSDRIHPASFMQLKEKRVAHFQSNEKIAEIEFNNIYLAVKSLKNGEILGYLGLPFYGSKRSFDKLVVEILTTIAKIFTTIFILLFLILRFSTRALTNPLRLLREKLRSTSLTTQNQPIDYQDKDEIGLLVSAYNNMIEQLEESKQALARSEKESAWREMAKQVAHEIKNPLTPMKLTLQHLLRTVPEPGTLRSIKTLLGQIETLADIATSFASYAKMPLPIEEEINIVEVLQQSIMLHRSDCLIFTDIPEQEFWVMGDKNMLGRIFSNLILNGIQAAQEELEPQIQIKLTKRQDMKVLIEFRDNGTGIPEEIQSKVFIPDFTTKKTGSGIGLALSKRGIEHLGGSIWFESQVGEGTTFFVEMPLVNSMKKSKQNKFLEV
jgi:signal transduction histidine kinase